MQLEVSTVAAVCIFTCHVYLYTHKNTSHEHPHCNLDQCGPSWNQMGRGRSGTQVDVLSLNSFVQVITDKHVATLNIDALFTVSKDLHTSYGITDASCCGVSNINMVV